MLEFWSAGNELVNSKKAMHACLDEMPSAEPGTGTDLLLLNTTMGHKFADLIEAVREKRPNAHVIGCTGCGVIGSGGLVSEKMRALSVMAIRGGSDDIAVSYSDKLSFASSHSESLDVARSLAAKNANINMILLIGASLDLVVDESFDAFAEVFGTEMPVFGWTATDNLKALKSNQFVDGKILEHGLIAVGFADPSLALTMGVHHGNERVGEPFVVTRAERNQILELDGRPAYPFIMERMNLPLETTFEEALRVVCFAAELPQALHAEYDNQDVLYVPLGTDSEKRSFDMAVVVEEGTKLWLTQRSEDKIFAGLDRMVSGVVERLNGQPPVAVLHSDCAARGRMSLSQIGKAEIVSRMQTPLCGDARVPWLGLYGYGEFTQLGGRNRFHNQTTSLYVLTRPGSPS